MVARSMPPSISIRKFKPLAARMVASLRTFSSVAGNELLPAETGIDRHHQDMVHNVEHLAEGLHRGGRD